MIDKYNHYKNLLLIDIEGEKWDSIMEIESGFYEVSTCGRIKSLERTVLHARYGSYKIKSRILKQYIHTNLLYCGLHKDNKNYKLKVATLVMETFSKIAKKENQVISHINRDSLDNTFVNLEYKTRAEIIDSNMTIRTRKSNYIGVKLIKGAKINSYVCTIQVNSKTITKTFKTGKEAALYYDSIVNKYNLKRPKNF